MKGGGVNEALLQENGLEMDDLSTLLRRLYTKRYFSNIVLVV